MLGFGIYFISCGVIFGGLLGYSSISFKSYILTFIKLHKFYGILFLLFLLPSLFMFIEGFNLIIHPIPILPIWITFITTLFFWIIYGLFFMFLVQSYKVKGKIPKIFAKDPCFGPFLTYGDNPCSSMNIHWGKNPKSKIVESDDEELSFYLGKNSKNLEKIFQVINSHDIIYSISLSNLEPNTKYFYRIPTKSSIYSFSTLPDPSISPEDLTIIDIVAISDCHGDGANLSKLVNLIEKECSKANFIISSGDNVSRGKSIKSWRKFFHQMEIPFSHIPFYSCPGNHDGLKLCDAEKWKSIFPYSYPNQDSGFFYSVNYDFIQFYFLDIYNAGVNPRIPSKIQLDWLIHELEKNKSQIVHRILILHNSIYSTGEFGSDPDLEKLLIPIIEKYHISLILTGHAHIFEVFYRSDINQPKGSLFLLNGGGGGKLDTILLNKIKFPTTPYKWEGTTHIAKIKPFLSGLPSNYFRNDEAVLNFQEFGKITNAFLKIRLNKKEIRIEAFDFEGNIIYKKSL